MYTQMNIFKPTILKTQNCKIKKCRYKSISVHGKNPYCKEHSYNFCCISGIVINLVYLVNEKRKNKSYVYTC